MEIIENMFYFSRVFFTVAWFMLLGLRHKKVAKECWYIYVITGIMYHSIFWDIRNFLLYGFCFLASDMDIVKSAYDEFYKQ